MHRDRACFEASIARRGLARALRTSLGEDEVGRLRNDVNKELRAT